MKEDFRVYDEKYGVSGCCAGLNGQHLCRFYIKWKKVLPNVFTCKWFDRDTHDCTRGRLI